MDAIHVHEYLGSRENFRQSCQGTFYIGRNESGYQLGRNHWNSREMFICDDAPFCNTHDKLAVRRRYLFYLFEISCQFASLTTTKAAKTTKEMTTALTVTTTALIIVQTSPITPIMTTTKDAGRASLFSLAILFLCSCGSVV